MLKKIDDTAYRDNVDTLLATELTFAGYIFAIYVCFATLFAIGFVGLTTLSVLIGFISLVHAFLSLRINHFARWDKRVNS